MSAAPISINRRKELRSNAFQSKRYLRIADELEADIKHLLKLQEKCIINDMESKHLAGVIQDFTDTMNLYRDNAIEVKQL